MALKLGLVGCGRMGKEIEHLAPEKGHQIVVKYHSQKPFTTEAKSKDVDVFIEFTHPKAVVANVGTAARIKKPLVIGTTGWVHELEKVRKTVESSTYINVGAYVDENTMVDSHALVGSCAQIGKNVHISAGSHIGGVLEPVGVLPVVIEDNVLVGGHCGICDGTVIRENAVLGAGTILTGSTPVYDVVNKEIIRKTEDSPLVIPEGAVVVRAREHSKIRMQMNTGCRFIRQFSSSIAMKKLQPPRLWKKV